MTRAWVLLALVACGDKPPPGPAPAPSASTIVALPVAPRGFLTPGSFADVARAANPSVVTVHVSFDRAGRDPFEAPADGRAPRDEPVQGVGSGFFVDAEGTLLTNHHVIAGGGTTKDAGAPEVRVTLFDEREMSAEVIGSDAPTDLAVLRVREAAPTRPIPFGDSDAIEVGDWVVAIGNPFGLSHTVSAGIVSGKGRSRDDVPLDPAGYYDFLQTDASINPGNSGGPLLDLQGRLIGINTAIRGGGAQGIGFAVPVQMVQQLLPMLLKNGAIVRSALGVKARDVRELPREDRARLGLAEGTKGAVLQHLEADGAAAAAKLQVGDVVVAFDGEPVDRATRLQWLASLAGVGKVVTLQVLRAGADGGRTPLSVRVTLGELARAR